MYVWNLKMTIIKSGRYALEAGPKDKRYAQNMPLIKSSDRKNIASDRGLVTRA